ncbi:MAG: hypothetical protein RID91_04755 [Azospirillaceae bacterium]
MAGIVLGMTASLSVAACATDGNMAARSVEGDPEKLIGLDAVAIAALLGEPELRRLERPAEVWQYRSDACVFDIFLYREEQGPRVVYYEARERRGEGAAAAPGAGPEGAIRQANAPRCLGTLLTRTGAVS